jgi:hypothetical protein
VLIVDELTMDTVGQFELWQWEGECVELDLIRTGASGDQARSMLAPGAKKIWTVSGLSHLDVMTKYYAYMDWGEYRSDWPDLDAIPFFYRDAMAVLTALPKSIKPLREIKIYADGHRVPAIPNPIPLITIQDRAVWSVNVWVFGDFGGHGEPPLNEPELITMADELLRRTKPHVFRRLRAALICPIDIAERMRWVPAEEGV